MSLWVAVAAAPLCCCGNRPEPAPMSCTASRTEAPARGLCRRYAVAASATGYTLTIRLSFAFHSNFTTPSIFAKSV